jgi:ribose transport system permease protein
MCVLDNTFRLPESYPRHEQVFALRTIEGSGAAMSETTAGATTEAATGADAQPPTDGQPRAGNSGRARFGRAVMAQEYLGVLVATVVLVLLIGAFYPRFLQFDQLMAILNQATYIGILACGMAFLLAMRELDLSVGSVYALTALACAMLVQNGVNAWLAGLLAIVVGGLLGLFNALLIQYFGLPSIVATLATLAMFRGLSLALSEGTQVLGPPIDDSFSQVISGDVLGVPVTGIVLIAVVVALTVVLRATPFGYRVRAIGSNPDAALFSGIPVNRVRMQAFILTGVLGGLAGVLTIGYLGAADPNTGTGYELQAIAAAVIGGTSLAGGRATIVGAALGAILLGVVGSGLAYFSVPINWNQFALGAVILGAVSLDSLVRRRRRTQAANSVRI